MNFREIEQKEKLLITNLLQNHELLSSLRLRPEYFLKIEHQNFINFIIDKNEINLKEIQHESVYNDNFLTIDEIGELYNSDTTSKGFFMQEQFEVLEEYKKRATLEANQLYSENNITLDNLVDKLAEIRNLTIKRTNENEHLVELLEELTSGEKPDIIKTGIKNIDNKIDGLEFGQLNILAARPSVGKTAITLQMMYEMARSGYDVTFFSLESTKKNLTKRLVSMLEGIELNKMKDFRNFSQDETDKFYNGVDKIVKSGLKVIYNPVTKPSDVRMEAIQQSDKKRIFFIDFAQLMEPDEKEFNRTAELEQISRALKRITTEYNVMIVLLAQIKRGNENQQDKRPTMADIKGSGGFEQDANVIFLLHREDYYDRDLTEDNGRSTIEVNIAKNKDGETGTVELEYYKRTQKFYSD